MESFVDIGLATGPTSGLLVVDVDDEAAWSKLRGEHREPVTLTARTPRDGRGRHVVFEYPNDVRIGSSAGEIAAGIDVRGDGGQIVVPPSRHEKTGRRYEWVDSTVAPAPLPAWLLDLLRATQRKVGPSSDRSPASYDGEPAHDWGEAGLDRIEEEVAALVEGERNDGLFRRACRASKIANGGHIDWLEAEQRLTTAALATGLDDEEIARALASARSTTDGEPLDGTTPKMTLAT